MKNAKRPVSSPASRTHAQPRKSGGGTLMGLFIGLVIGLLIALGVAWYLRQAPLPFENKYQGAPAPASAPAQSATAGKPIALPGKPGGDANAKPRFDFYGILEGKQAAGSPGDAKPEVPVAPSTTTTAAPAVAEAKPVAGAKEPLFLQVGAYSKASDADNARAKLTLLGFETEIIEADIPEKGRMFRVRTGPYASPEAMNAARTTLSQNGIQAALVRGK